MLGKDSLILIVDDMKMVRTSITKYLTALGYENFVQAENGNEALKVFEKSQSEGPKVGAVFLDIVMPIMDGREALRKIRELDQSVPVIMLTSVADDNVINDCRSLGITDYLLKPINAESGPERLSTILSNL